MRLIFALACCSTLAVALAVDLTPALPNAELQLRYERLTHELRCMQCQNESLADSNVGLAADLRLQVRELLVTGKTDDEVRDYMVARYGEFILFRPRMNWRNAWLWAAPAVLLLLGGWITARIIRSRANLPADSDDEPGTGRSG